MKKFWHLFIVLFCLTAPLMALDPKTGSPLQKGVHPRLYLTEETIPEIRQVIGDNFRSNFQQYVNWAANANDNDSYNILHEAGHDPTRALMIHQAFIAALGQVPGISYPISFEDYARRAINRLISRLNAGDNLSYAAAMTADWTYNFQTSSERTQIANLMLSRKITHKVFDHSIQNPQINPEQMFSSKYYETNYAWYQALAFWGDGRIDAEADNAADTFYDDMLNYGYLDAANFVAGEWGGFSEWIGYTSWHPRTHMLNLDGWHTATGEDYVSREGTTAGNALKNYPKFMRYAMDPHRYFNEFYTYLRMGSAEATDPSFRHRSMREQIYYLGGVLHRAGLDDEAGLIRDMIEKYNVTWPNYEHQWLYVWLGIYKAVAPKTPEELSFPRYIWNQHLGVFYARTGFSSPADGVFAAMDGHYRYDGHQGAEDYSGFILTKFGTLVNTRHVAHRNYGNLNNYPGGYEENTIFFEGGYRQTFQTMDTPKELKDAINGVGNYDHGGLEQLIARDGYFYHMRSRRDRELSSGAKHTREYVWLPGSDPENDSDFLVIYDRASAPTKAQFVYHVPWKPSVAAYSSGPQDISTGSGESDRIGDRYSGANLLVKALNGTGGEKDSEGGKQDYVGGANAHGVAFVKNLLPNDVNVELTRVARFDSDVIKRQHELAIKTHRWQVAVIPRQLNTDERFLHVFQTGDANKVSAMTATSLIEVGNTMQGVFIEKESGARPNYVVLFNKANGPNTNTVTYSVSGSGVLRHVITGLEPRTTYEVEDALGSGTTVSSVVTEPMVQTWDYRGVDSVTKTGTLYFETTLNGNHRFIITKSGQQDNTPPAKPSGFNIKP
ncbi:MAG TPA: hypothetical protein ENJ15_04525 [Caldithrix abyssi]|uniref:Uncharacterized protein n=1 Tax=Caldithrix abyssi TaxID=187145 RepID=A0A7V5RPZ6_CALAY|nr:hypothetical protein [Caldithrix abyssi]